MRDLENLNHIDHSSNIFSIKPTENPQIPYLTIPTRFLLTTLGMALSRKAAAQRHEAFVLLDYHLSLRGAARWIFEHSAHTTLSNPNRPPLPTYINYETGRAIPPAKQMKSGPDALRNIQPPFDFYWRPQDPNFPGVDALIRQNNEIWVLQYTISKRHCPATGGLDRVYDLMGHKQMVTWYLVLLGSQLSDAEEARRKQQLTGRWKTTNVYASELALAEEWLFEEIEE